MNFLKRESLLLSSLRTAITYIVTIAIVLSCLPTYSFAANADNGYYSQPNDTIANETAANMIKLTTDDVSSYYSIVSWLQNKESYIWTRTDSSGHTSYYFNVPNLQLNINNMLQKINPGGWTPYAERDINTSGVTTEQRYGYSLPDSIYLGETPIVFIDVSAVVKDTATPWNAVKVVVSGVANTIINGVAHFLGFGDVDLETDITNFNPSYIKNVYYVNTDYINSNSNYTQALEALIEKRWDDWTADKDDIGIKIDDKNLFDDGVIVSSSDTDRSGEKILNALMDKTGSSYSTIIEILLNYSHDNYGDEIPSAEVERDMPYDISTMSSGSRAYMNNIADPRVSMAKDGTFLNLGSYLFKPLVNNIVNTLVINLTGILMQISSILNSICDLKFLESNGLDLTIGWAGSIGKFIAIALVLAVIVSVIISLIKLLTGSGGKNSIMTKLIFTAVMLGTCLALLANPTSFANILTNTASKIMSFGTSALEMNDQFNELYTSGATDADKSSLRFWYMYYNTWTSYATNHDASDQANIFNYSQGTNEYTDFSNPAKFSNGDEINLWPVVLIETMDSGDTRATYRVSDHYLAPIITPGANGQFSVTNNPYYNGYMFSQIPFGAPVLAMCVALFVLLKLLCFLELCIDIMLIFINLALGAVDGAANSKAFVLNIFKRLGWDALKVFVYDLLITMVIYSSSIVSGNGTIVMALLVGAATVILFRSMFVTHSNSILYPNICKVFESGMHKFNLVFNGENSTWNSAKKSANEFASQRDTIRYMRGGMSYQDASSLAQDRAEGKDTSFESRAGMSDFTKGGVFSRSTIKPGRIVNIDQANTINGHGVDDHLHDPFIAQKNKDRRDYVSDLGNKSKKEQKEFRDKTRNDMDEEMKSVAGSNREHIRDVKKARRQNRRGNIPMEDTILTDVSDKSQQTQQAADIRSGDKSDSESPDTIKVCSGQKPTTSEEPKSKEPKSGNGNGRKVKIKKKDKGDNGAKKD